MAKYRVLAEKYWAGDRVVCEGEIIELPQRGLKGESLQELTAEEAAALPATQPPAPAADEQTTWARLQASSKKTWQQVVDEQAANAKKRR